MSKDYTIIKETSVDTLIAQGTKNAKSQWAADKAGEGAWAQTVALIQAHHGFEAFNPADEDKKLKDTIRQAFKDAFMNQVANSETDEIPSRGWNARKNVEFDVINEKGEVNWSSWAGTRKSISYCGEFARWVKEGKLEGALYDTLPEGGLKVYHKSAAKKKLGKQSPLQTIAASIEMIRKKYPEVSLGDIENVANDLKALADEVSKAKDAKDAIVAEHEEQKAA